MAIKAVLWIRIMVMEIRMRIRIRLTSDADPDTCHLQIDAESDPVPDYFYADPDFYLIHADPDPGYQNDADPCGSGSTTLAKSLIIDMVWLNHSFGLEEGKGG
jgi:hypothetical protein